jgi:hypothetical protein
LLQAADPAFHILTGGVEISQTSKAYAF